MYAFTAKECRVDPDDKAGNSIVGIKNPSQGEGDELIALGMLSRGGTVQAAPRQPRAPGYHSVSRRAVRAPSVLNEAYEYSLPSSFSRGQAVDLGDIRLVLISGTASVDESGQTVHAGDFRAQCWRTYRNITALLQTEGATWHDVVRCTCYLRDIERDYQEFNRVRTAFFRWLALNPFPASVAVQARLCRQELLIEMEATAILQKQRDA